MVGLAPPAPVTATSSPQTPPAAGAPKLAASKTMLGVAIPGIAPLRPGEGTHSAAAQGSTLRQREPLPRGVDAPLPRVLPAPAPMADVPAPPPPRIVRKGGVPLVAVALAAGALVVIGGAAIAYFWHGAPPISALPRVTPEGTDVLHLSCDAASCKDGTVVTIGGASATFAAGAADLPLAQSLHVGQNALSLHVDRPGMGRDEVVALSVPVAYRVRADVSAMNGPHPSILIHVEALAGSEVRVADKAVTLDASGAGTYAIDEGAATEGPADESRVVSLDVPYTVASAGHAPEAGTVSARVAVAPLRVDAPGARAVVETDQVLLAGRAAKGATVTVDGAAAAVAADGTFEKSVPLSAPGEVSVEVRSGTAALVTANRARRAQARGEPRGRGQGVRKAGDGRVRRRPREPHGRRWAVRSSSTARSSSLARRGTGRSFWSTTGAAAQRGRVSRGSSSDRSWRSLEAIV